MAEGERCEVVELYFWLKTFIYMEERILRDSFRPLLEPLTFTLFSSLMRRGEDWDLEKVAYICLVKKP